MFILIFQIFANACQSYHDEYNLYPTQGEILEMPLQQIFGDQVLKFNCFNCPEGVTVENVINQIGEYKSNYTFVSVSFQKDYFVALTTNHTLNIYAKKMTGLELEKIININQNLTCFNVIYTIQNKILLDCYQDQQLFLYYVEAYNLIQVYNSQSVVPKRTKLNSFINQTNIYTIYEQIFEAYGYLTIFEEKKNYSFNNLTNLKGNIVNFFVSSKGLSNNQIFVQFLNKIAVYILSSQEKLKTVYFAPIKFEILNMVYFYSIDTYYQFDRFIMITKDQDISFQEILYSNNFLQQFSFINNEIDFSQTVQLFANRYFIITFDEQVITIFKNERDNIIMLAQHTIFKKFNNIIIYFDQFTSELYLFDQTINIYQLSLPKIKFQSNKLIGNFVIKANKINSQFDLFGCQVQISFQQINTQNQNIYLIYHNKQFTYYNLLQYQFRYPILEISGPLIQFKNHVSNLSFGEFLDDTLQQFKYQFKQKYQMIKIFAIDLIKGCKSNPIGCCFIVAVTNQSIDFYQEEFILISQSINIQNYTIDKNQIEISYFAENQSFFYQVGLSLNSTYIQIFNFQNRIKSLFINNNIILQTEPYRQYQLLQNAVVLILVSNQLVIYTFDNKKIILLNTSILTDLCNRNISLNPINIFINQQQQSRIIYINNYDSFLIGTITEQYSFVLFSLTFVDVQIINLSVIQSQLILAYYCEDQLNLCFQVWNVMNLHNPSFQKYLTSIPSGYQVSFYSDNIFLYVTTDNIIKIFNPQKSQHSSLYKQTLYDGQYFSCIAYKNIALLSFNQSLYSLTPIQIAIFKSTNIEYDYFSQQIFNFTYYSELNNSSQINSTNNQLIIVNNYIDIKLKDQAIQVPNNQTKSISIYRDDLATYGQIDYFETDIRNDVILTNTIQNFSLTELTQQYNLITYVNNYYVLLNNQSILTYPSFISYDFGPFSICLDSVLYQDTIYVLCKDQDDDIFKVVSLNILNETYIEQSLVLSGVQIETNNSWMRIQDDLIYIWDRNRIRLYYLYQDQKEEGTEICECTQHSFQAIILQQDQNRKIIAYFYFKVYSKYQMSYKIARISKNTTIQLGNEANIVLGVKPFQTVEFDTILYLNSKIKEILLLISNQSFNCIISILWINNPINVLMSQMVFQNIIQTSPPFTRQEFNLTQQPFYSSDYLLFIYSNLIDSSQQVYLITLYNISNLQNAEKSSPLLYEGGYNFTLNQTNIYSTSFKAKNLQKGEILILLNNNTIWQLNVNIFSIYINLPSDFKNQNLSLNLRAVNYNKSDEATLIIFQTKQIIYQQSLYALASLIVIVIVTAILVYYEKSKNYNVEQEFDYLETEI